LNIIRRVDLIRNGFHIGIGAWNVRDKNDQIQVYDDYIEGILIRIYRPLNASLEKDMMPTILFYHGGGYSVGSAGIINVSNIIFFIYLLYF